MKIFGFEIGKATSAGKSKTIQGFSTPISTDGTIEINGSMTSAYYGHVLNMDDINVNDEKGLILKYRMAAAQPECDLAVSDIVNAAIISDNDKTPVTLTLDSLDYPEEIKRRLRDEFDNIVKMLNFNFDGHDIFRRWYIDGKLYYHLVVDNDNMEKGVQEMRLIDPLKMKKIKEVTTRTNKETGARVKYVSDEYYLYTEDIHTSSDALKIHPDSICYVPSGILDESGTFSISYLHKCIKLVNQLRIMEDSLVIYRISRAPERRIFYIDVGNLPKGKAEEYVQGIMSKYKNKLVYDASSGEVREDRKSMNIMEDFWLPRREGGRGTEIQTLPGGENLGQIDDIIFFQKKLYRALNVPAGRLDSDNAYNIGRVSEITREEVKFQKFINKLRRKFSLLFINALRIQCILKKVCTNEEWKIIRENISVDFIEDNYFSEIKEFEIIKDRLEVLSSIEQYIGKYYSEKWVRSNILNQSDEDIERMDAENNEAKVGGKKEEEPPADDFGGDSNTDFGTPDEGGSEDDGSGLDAEIGGEIAPDEAPPEET
jgi:hypothetical protein